jgi:hypothetical protein
MAEPRSKKEQRPIRVRSPLLKKVVGDARAYARQLAEGGSADDDEASPGSDSRAVPDAPAQDGQASGHAAVTTAGSQSCREPAVVEQPVSGNATAPEGEAADEGATKTQGNTARARKPRSLGRQTQAAGDGALRDSRPKPYVSIAELAQLTPWTEQAIRTMISKGIFVEGKHYYHVGRRTVFKWKQVCQFIDEGRPASSAAEAPVPHYRDRRKR